jgi:hypothetical protein
MVRENCTIISLSFGTRSQGSHWTDRWSLSALPTDSREEFITKEFTGRHRGLLGSERPQSYFRSHVLDSPSSGELYYLRDVQLHDTEIL